MKTFLSFVILFTGMSLSAQQQGSSAPVGTAANPELNQFANFQGWTPMMQKMMEQIKNDDEYITYYVGAEVGSPYEEKEFKKGKVFYGDEFLGSSYYRYNAFSNEIEVKRTNLEEEKQLALRADSKIRLIKENGREMGYKTFINSKGKTENGYLTRIYKGTEYNLYKRIAAKFTEAKPAQNTMVNPIPSRFSHFIDYYVEIEGQNSIDAVPTSKGKLLKYFDNTGKDLKSYLKQERLNLSEEQDLIRLIQFLDES